MMHPSKRAMGHVRFYDSRLRFDGIREDVTHAEASRRAGDTSWARFATDKE